MFFDFAPRIFIFFAGPDASERSGGRGKRQKDTIERSFQENTDLVAEQREKIAKTPTCVDGKSQAEILVLVRGGDLHAFEAVYRTYFPLLWKFAYSLVRSRDAAEELLHDLFLMLWERHETLEVHEDLGVYLQVAVRNRAYKHSRHANVVRRLEQAIERHTVDLPAMGQIAGPEAEFDTAEITRVFKEALAAVPERDRQIVIMRWEDGLTFDEIARILGLSKTRIRAIVARVQERVRPFFERIRDG